MTEAEIIEEGAPLYHAILRSLVMPDFVSEETCDWVCAKLRDASLNALEDGEETLSLALDVCASVYENGAKE